MNWDKLFSMQKQLDGYIQSKHHLKETDIFQAKILALLVELGELANETRCFKFWSTKPRNEKTVILEEYVDGVHFILSLGIDKEYLYEDKALETVITTETEQFNHVFEAAVAFKGDPSKLNYETLFTNYLQLGKLLGFSEADIQAAYMKKNEINYERQIQGY
ncbi:dUTPase [Virgibacillus indicus]|uniref:dUTPase n=1 Tax=Virgibacillus indicus TaxID=2024554 RepID=A0A265NDB1_9BACI|nr:dUTP diphosphatase [Virgibacillus indicus]OZU89765.1 dUTPase [Virgibacillus indicus]